MRPSLPKRALMMRTPAVSCNAWRDGECQGWCLECLSPASCPFGGFPGRLAANDACQSAIILLPGGDALDAASMRPSALRDVGAQMSDAQLQARLGFSTMGPGKTAANTVTKSGPTQVPRWVSIRGSLIPLRGPHSPIACAPNFRAHVFLAAVG